MRTIFQHLGFKVILTRYWNCYVHEHRYFFVLKWPGHKQISKDFCTAQQANEAALEIAEALEGNYLRTLRQELSRTWKSEPALPGSLMNRKSATPGEDGPASPNELHACS